MYALRFPWGPFGVPRDRRAHAEMQQRRRAAKTIAKRSATKHDKSLYMDGAGPMRARNPDLAPNVLRDLHARGLWQRRE
eukprot:CAMPEP_0198488012 /NCGR_PEP_ID=MMETSP1462-20131121/438_1 /TAXON_ID=1333877 /ORGANISM="Brandtodinium nutriculum, Strain RCC3387" /LENGTH=78 /DNA_ID=CAMNT_0044216463 /DNA_START=26 /DNA_END=259 /DNA_ORIENTATION=-